MYEGIPQKFLLLIAAAFVLGWLVAKFGTFISNRAKAKSRDPRDDRIRSLEADHRVAHTDAQKAKDTVDGLKKELRENQETAENRDKVIDEQMTMISQLRSDLKESVKKTRELRAELSDRATESVRSEVKLREVETELEVSRASTDMIATWVLDYSITPDPEEENEKDDGSSAAKAAS